MTMPNSAKIDSQLAVLVIGIFLCSLAYFIVMPLVPLMISNFENQKNIELWAGMVMGVSALVSAAVNPIWGHISAKYGAKSMLLKASFGLSLTYFFTPFATSLPQLFLLRCLNGLMAGYIPAALAMISKDAMSTKIGKSMAYVSIAQAAGTLCGPAIGGFLSAKFGIHASFNMAAVMVLICGLLSLVYLKNVQFNTDNYNISLKKSIKIMVQSTTIRNAILFTFFIYILGSTLQPIIPLQIKALTLNPTQTSIYLGGIYSTGGAVSLIFGLLWGRATDKWGLKKILPIVFAGGFVSCLLLFSSTSIVGFTLSFAVYSVFSCALGIIANINIAKSASEKNLAMAFSINHTGAQLGNALGPVLGGFIATAFALSGTFIFTSALFLIAIVILFHFFLNKNVVE